MKVIKSDFDELTDEQKKECYKSYVDDMVYEWGDRAKYMSYKEWCEESRELGEPIL